MSTLSNTMASAAAGIRHWLTGRDAPRPFLVPKSKPVLTEPGVEEVGNVLSPTGVNQYLSCSFRWYAKHVLKVPDPKTGSTLLGSAVDRALTENFREKIETKCDLPLAGVRAIYLKTWDDLNPEAEFHRDEDPGQLRLEGEGLTMLLMDRWAPTIEPAAVQLKVSGPIGGVPVRGYIDLLDVDGRVIDLKTAKKTPSEISSDYRFQVATYARLLPREATGIGMVATAVRNKTPKIVEHTFQIDASDVASVERLYPIVQQSIRKGVFLPNRSHFMCSRRYCSAWRVCEKEFGGKVAE